jgi:demethylmenaquinone methyltransferase/2-methoxy-6-polyprenyl-1,4-benzoquinol methylase
MKGFYLVSMKSEMERVTRPREKARESYNSMSRWYDLFTGSEKKFTDIGLRMLNVKPNETVLEIGCGTGHALVEFANKRAKVYAIDISERMIKVAKSKIRSKNVGLCQADGLFIPFPAASFDSIFLSFTLELFDTPEIPKILRECHRVLKDNGRIGVVALAKQEVLTIRIYEWFHKQMPNFVDCRPIYLKPLLNGAGFQIQESTTKIMWGLPVEIIIGYQG